MIGLVDVFCYICQCSWFWCCVLCPLYRVYCHS